MVKKYFRRGGTWQYSHNNATLSNYTTVNVGFSRDGNEEGETQFDIEKYNVDELNELFDEFVKENNFSNVIHITSHMKKLFLTERKSIGKCHVQWEPIFLKVMISVLSYFYFHYQMENSV